MTEIAVLKNEVLEARVRYLDSVKDLTTEQGLYKPADNIWSAAEITEHLVIAEQGGINGIWKALTGLRSGNPTWRGEHINKGLNIDEVIQRTWKEKENVPEGAAPRLGGPLEFWISAMESCQILLERIAEELEGEVLDIIIYPHPISGPLDARQRFQFLRFHMDRHRQQVERLKQHAGFPELFID
jgi:hypothetical protein